MKGDGKFLSCLETGDLQQEALKLYQKTGYRFCSSFEKDLEP